MFNINAVNPSQDLKIIRDRQEQLWRLAGHSRLLREPRRHRRRR